VYERPASTFVASFMGTSNLMSGIYSGGSVAVHGGPTIAVGVRPNLADGSSVRVSVRPEKIWLSEHEPEMVRVPGAISNTVYSGPTTTYLIEIAPGVTVAALEQNTDRSRNEERWTDGQRVELGWRAEHCLVLTDSLAQNSDLVAA
jgi:spermidine/putrescine transport system ATP-binding protein